MSAVSADLLTLPALGRRSGISRTTLWERAKRGEDVLPGVRAVKIGSRWFVALRQYERFLETAGQPAAAAS